MARASPFGHSCHATPACHRVYRELDFGRVLPDTAAVLPQQEDIAESKCARATALLGTIQRVRAARNARSAASGGQTGQRTAEGPRGVSGASLERVGSTMTDTVSLLNPKVEGSRLPGDESQGDVDPSATMGPGDS